MEEMCWEGIIPLSWDHVTLISVDGGINEAYATIYLIWICYYR